MKQHTLIIGGTRGIGRSVAERFADDGHTVSVIGRRPPADANQPGSSITYWAADLTKTAPLKKTLAAIVRRNGKINNLIFVQRFRSDGDTWNGEIALSLTATRTIIEWASSRFGDPGRNAVVLVGSVAGRWIVRSQPLAYHVAKAAMAQMARYYAFHLGPKGIRVNCVSPCTVVKQENRDLYLNDKKLQALYKGVVPIGRMGDAADVAGVVRFLCGSDAAFITGQDIVVDGGLSLLYQESLARGPLPAPKRSPAKGRHR